MGVICRIALFQTKSQLSCSLPGFNYLSSPTSEEKSSTFKKILDVCLVPQRQRVFVLEFQRSKGSTECEDKRLADTF